VGEIKMKLVFLLKQAKCLWAKKNYLNLNGNKIIFLAQLAKKNYCFKQKL